MLDEPVTEPVRRLIAKYENRIERLEKANGRLCEQINSMPEIKTCTMSIDKSKIDNDEVESLVCSLCGYETFRQYTFGNEGEFISYPEPNYCPHCGAKVVG